MQLLRDVLRLVGPLLVAHAVYTNSVASAICAGTLFTGGFDEASVLFSRLRRRAVAPAASGVGGKVVSLTPRPRAGRDPAA